MQDFGPREFSQYQWHEQASQMYLLIKSEFEDVLQHTERIDGAYLKLVISCKFFSLLRGEFFEMGRPGGLGEQQKEIYAFENELFELLQQVRKQVNFDAPISLQRKQELEYWFKK